MPSWLADGNTTVLLKRHVRSSKYEPLVDEVELLEANHQYAHIRHPDGRESTVSTNHLAPAGEEASETELIPAPREEFVPASGESTPVEPLHETQVTVPPSTTVEPELRRSQRQRRAPERYGYN